MEPLCLGRGLAVDEWVIEVAGGMPGRDQESLSPREGMVADVLSIVHTLSCRLQGLRGYEKTLKVELVGGGR